MKIKHYIHGDYDPGEIVEGLEESEVTKDLDTTVLERIADKIYDFCYEVGFEFDVDPFTGEVLGVELIK